MLLYWEVVDANGVLLAAGLDDEKRLETHGGDEKDDVDDPHDQKEE